jgi:hypothetical protein
VGVAYSVTLATLLLRGFLFKPGLWEFNDFAYNFNQSVQGGLTSATWDPFLGSNTARFLPELAWYSWLNLLGSSELAQRVEVLLTLAVPALCVFVVTYVLTATRFGESKALPLSLISSTFAVVNPFVAMRLDNLSYVFNIGVLAVALFAAHSAANETSRGRIARTALILSLLVVLDSRIPYTLIEVYLVMLVVALYEILRSRENIVSRLVRELIFGGLTTAASVAMLAFWLMPYATQFLTVLYPSPNQAVLELAINPSNHIYRSGGILNALRLLTDFWTPVYFQQNGISATVWVLLTFVVPIASLSAILLRPRDKVVVTGTLVALIGIVLSSGPTGSFGTIYMWLAAHLPLGASVMYDQDYFTMLTVAMFAVLLPICLGEVWKRLEWMHLSGPHLRGFTLVRVLAVLVLSLVTASAIVSAYPLAEGNLENFLTPVQQPGDYVNTNQFLGSNLNGHRALWAPTEIGDSTFGWALNWLPNANVTSYPSDFLVDLPDQPILYPLAGTYNRPIYSFLVNAISGNRSTDLAKYLGLANIGYFVYHGDTVAPDVNLLASLGSQRNMSLVQSYGELSAFANQYAPPPIYAVNNTIITVGGLDSLLPLLKIASFNPSHYAVYFADQQPTSLKLLSSLLSFNSTLLFYGDKTYNDLVFDTLNSSSFASPIQYYGFSSANLDWHAGSVTDSQGLRSYLGNTPYRGEFDLGQGFVWTSTDGSEYDMPITLPQAQPYAVYVRLLRSPTGGQITVTVGHSVLGVIDTKSDLAQSGFQWVKLAPFNLTGTETLTFRSDRGSNILNSVAVVSSRALSAQRASIDDLVIRNKVNLVYVPYPGSALNTSEPMGVRDELGKALNLGNTTLAAEVGGVGCVIASYARQGAVRNWTYFEPKGCGSSNSTPSGNSSQVIYFLLNHGILPQTNITASSALLGAQMTPLDWRYQSMGTSQTQISARTSSPAILLFMQPYDQFWIGTVDGNSLLHFPSYSDANGFIVDHALDSKVQFTYSPESSFQIGVAISVSSVLVAIVAILWVELKPMRSMVEIFRRAGSSNRKLPQP